MATKAPVTADQFFQLPETNQFVELLDGEIIMSPSPIPDHQDVVGNSYVVLKQAAKQRGGRAFIAPLDVQFDELNVPQPDAIYLAPDSRCVVEEKRLVGAPDLLVEVVSPGSTKRDRSDKFLLYERYGVREYWIIDPRDQLVEVWQWKEGRFSLLGVFGPEETFESSLVGGVEVAALFAK
jgi:Uma2 family endonuclease